MRQSASLRLAAVILTILQFSTNCAAAIVNEKISVKEGVKTGTVLVNVAKILAQNSDEVPGRAFKLLSQKLVLDKGINKRKTGGEQKWMSVDKYTGIITWDRTVDREKDCAGSTTCVIKVQAVMLPQRYFSLLNLDVEIEDVNDNAPEFRGFLFPLNISEDSATGTLLNVDQYKALDSDKESNSVISYELEKNKYFQLEESTDETGVTHLLLELIQPLDYELHKAHEITLTAKDGGRPPRTSQKAIQINVINENDNGPVFLREEYQVTLREHLPSGRAITHVTALDDDMDEFGAVTYYFPDHDVGSTNTWRDFVQLDNITGSVTLLEELDREKHDGLRIPIEARDGDPINPKKGHTWLVINVNDVNDNDPTISVNFIVDSEGDKAYVSETSPVGTYLAYVITSDADGGDNGRVVTSIQSVMAPGSTKNEGPNNATGQFVMTKDGLITTGRAMDRETCNEYKIITTACDMGMPPRCARKIISIVILDENEHTPSFEAPTQMVTLREDSEVGTHVTSVTAQDADSNNGPALMMTKAGELRASNYGEVSYSIQGFGGETFAIEPKSGMISLKRKLDREEQSEWRLTVVASDAGYPERKSSTCEVVIEVDDVNDNAPVFVNPAVNNSLLYASITDDVITRIQAKDLDKGNNGKLRYSIVYGYVEGSPEVGNRTPGFVIDPETGDLSFHDKVAPTSLIGEHPITIMARDSGNPPLSSFFGIRLFVSEAPVKVMTSAPTHHVMSKDFLTLAVSLGTATVVLLLIVVIVVLKCKHENKRVRTYRCREAEVSKTKSCVACSCDDSSQDDVNDVRSDLTSPSSSSSRPETATTAADASKSGTWKGPNNRCDTDSMFSSSNGSHMTHSDVSGLQGANCQSSPNDRPSISCIVPMGPRLVSPIAKTGQSVSSHPDSDSGRGESETDANSYDTHDGGEYGTRSLKRSPLTMGADDDVFQRDIDGAAPGGMGVRCTQQCLEFGHSDLCWMPSPEQRYIGKRHMSSPTSGYGVPKPGYFCAANQYGAKKCNRLESIRETLPIPSHGGRLQYLKPSSCSDLQQDEISYRDLLAHASNRMHKHLTNGPYHSSTDVYESCKAGSRTPSTEHLSQVSSACSAPERSLSHKERAYGARATFKHPEYVNAQQARRIKGYKSGSRMSPSQTAPALTDDENEESSVALITASEAQEIIDDINRLLV